MVPTKFRFIWLSGFRGEFFLEVNQSESRIVCGVHVCKLIGMKWAFFTEDLPKMLPTKLWFIWPNGFRGEEFQKSANQKQESSVAAMFVHGSGRHEQSLQITFHRCFLPRFGSFGQAVSEENNFFKLTNQKQELPVAAMFIEDLPEMLPIKFWFTCPSGIRGEHF